MSFQTDGYELRALFAPALMASLQAEVLAHIDRVARALYVPFEDSAPGASLAERLDRVAARDPSYANLLRVAACTDAHRAPAFAALAEDPALRGAVRELMGSDPEGLVMRLRANIPALPEQRERWHSDVALADGSPCSRLHVTCWIPLMDAGPGSGGLELVSGRRSAPFAHRSDQGKFVIPEDDLQGLPQVQPVCPAGSALFLDRFTPHRALPNHSGRARWSLVIWARAPAAAGQEQERQAA